MNTVLFVNATIGFSENLFLVYMLMIACSVMALVMASVTAARRSIPIPYHYMYKQPFTHLLIASTCIGLTLTSGV